MCDKGTVVDKCIILVSSIFCSLEFFVKAPYLNIQSAHEAYLKNWLSAKVEPKLLWKSAAQKS